MTIDINPHKKILQTTIQTTILYINEMNTSQETAQRQADQISQSLSNTFQSFFCQCVYNPANTYHKTKDLSINAGVIVLNMASITSDRVFVITHGDGVKHAAKIFEKMNSYLDKNHPIRKKISLMTFGTTSLLLKQIAQIDSIQNFIFEKDRISTIALNINPKDKSNQNIIWLNDPKKIPKKKLSSSANPWDKVARNIEYGLVNLQKRHQFESYLPHITQELSTLMNWS